MRECLYLLIMKKLKIVEPKEQHEEICEYCSRNKNCETKN